MLSGERKMRCCLRRGTCGGENRKKNVLDVGDEDATFSRTDGRRNRQEAIRMPMPE